MIDLNNLRSLDCQNVGDGLGLYTQASGTIDEILGFKTLIGGPGIILNADDSTITIEYVGLGGGGLLPFSKIVGAPSTITPLGILFGTPDGRLDFVASPSTAGYVLSFDGNALRWAAPSTGTVSKVELFAGPGIALDGSAITDAGSYTIGLQASGVTAGTYTAPQVSIDAYGRVTSAVSTIVGDVVDARTLGTGFEIYTGKSDGVLAFRSIVGTNGTTVSSSGDTIVVSSGGVTSVGLTGSNDILVQGSPVTSNGTFALSLAATGITAGSFTAASLTIDENGRILAASSNPIGEANDGRSLGGGTSIFTGKTDQTFNFRSITTSGAISATATDTELNLNVDVGVTQLTVTGTGIVVAGSPVTTSGTIDLSLATTGVVAGQYANPVLTIGEDGRITAAVSAADAAEVSVLSGDGISVSQGPAFTVSLAPSTVTPGTYSNCAFTIDAYGRVTMATPLPPAPVAPIDPSLVSLDDTGVVPGTYGNPQITVNAQGRITGISITNPGPFVGSDQPTTLPATGVAAGRYTNPTLQIEADGRVSSASASDSSLLPIAGDVGDILTKTNAGSVWAPPVEKVIPKDAPACMQWRLSITKIDTSGTGMLGIQNISFRSSVGGPEIGVASTILTNDQGWGLNYPENAFNRQGGMYVSTAPFSPTGVCTIGLTYTANVVPRDVYIQAPISGTYFGPTVFDIQYCEGGVWTTAWSVNDVTPWAPGETRAFPSTQGPIDEAFRTLADTPNSYIGAAMSTIRVKQTEDGLEFVPEVKRTGTHYERPIYDAEDVGKCYFDTSLGAPIWWTGAEWINATGSPTTY